MGLRKPQAASPATAASQPTNHHRRRMRVGRAPNDSWPAQMAHLLVGPGKLLQAHLLQLTRGPLRAAANSCSIGSSPKASISSGGAKGGRPHCAGIGQKERHAPAFRQHLWRRCCCAANRVTEACCLGGFGLLLCWYLEPAHAASNYRASSSLCGAKLFMRHWAR